MNRLKKFGTIGLIVVFFLGGFVFSGELIRKFEGHSKVMFSNSAFSPDGTMIASGSKDETIKLQDAQNGTLVHTLEEYGSVEYSLAFSPDGKTLASGGSEGFIRLWNVQNGTRLHMLDGHDNAVYSIAFSPDGKTIASGGYGKNIKLWNAQKGTLLHTLKAHTHKVFSIAFSPDGTTIASGGYDNDYSIKLWDAQNGTLLNSLKNPKGIGRVGLVLNVVFSPDGTMIASGGHDRNIKLWDTEKGTLLQILKGHSGSISSLAFSRDGKVIVSGSNHNIIKLWDIHNGTLIHTIKGRSSHFKELSVNSLSFSPDGTVLTSGGRDGYFKLWDVSPYNETLANQIYKSIDKSNYAAFYEFTKKFYNRFDVVQQAYSDIYKAVIKEDTLDGYEWYQAHVRGNTIKEIGTIKKRLNTFRQEKYTKEYESVKEENNLAVYEYYANTHSRPKADKLEDAISNMHKLALKKAKDIDTVSSYNTFVFAYPSSDEVEEANRLAYELEKDKYTDIGMVSFFGKGEKMNKQARSLLIEAQSILDIALEKEKNSSIIDTGYYMVVNRMYELAKNEFSDTDRVLTLKESHALKKFNKTFQHILQKQKGNIKKIESGLIEDAIEMRVASTKAVMSHSDSDSKMKEFYNSEQKNAKQFIESIKKIHRKKRDERLNKIKVKIANFEALYQKVLNEYKSELSKVRSTAVKEVSSESSPLYIKGNDSINSNSNFSPKQKVQQSTQSLEPISNQLTDSERQELEQLRAEKAEAAKKKETTSEPVSQSQTASSRSFPNTRTNSYETYIARISQKDHYGKSGQKLKDAGTILQQDRANYHKYYKRDREDRGDSRFGTRDNRDKIKRMLARGSSSQKTLDAIRYSTPIVKVKIYQEHIDVTLESNGAQTSQRQHRKISSQRTTVPVMIGGDPDLDACGGTGVIHGISRRGDGFLAIRSGPGAKYKMIDKFYRNGKKVTMCDDKGKWVGIVYGKDCGEAYDNIAKRKPYEGSCKSGWVYEKYIRLIAG